LAPRPSWTEEDKLATCEQFTAITAHPAQARDRHSLTATVVQGLADLLTTLDLWQQRVRQRRALARLSDYNLKDVGLSRADVEREVTKPFWRP